MSSSAEQAASATPALPPIQQLTIDASASPPAAILSTTSDAPLHTSPNNTSSKAAPKITLIFKYFDVEAQKVSYLGQLCAAPQDKIADLTPEILKLAGWSSGTSFSMFEETDGDMIEPMETELTLAQSELQDGDTIIVQKALSENEQSTLLAMDKIVHVREFYKDLRWTKRTRITFIPINEVKNTESTFELILSKQTSSTQLAEKVADHLKIDTARLSLYPISTYSINHLAPIEYTTDDDLVTILERGKYGDPVKRNDALYYKVLTGRHIPRTPNIVAYGNCETCSVFCNYNHNYHTSSSGTEKVVMLEKIHSSSSWCCSCGMLLQAAKFVRASCGRHFTAVLLSQTSKQLFIRGYDLKRSGYLSKPFEFYRLKSGLKRPWIDVPCRLQASGDTASQHAVAWTKARIANCKCFDQYHPRPGETSFFPARILDLGPVGSALTANVRLCESTGEQALYATLSHCWGSVPHLKLLRSNLDDFKTEILLDKVPRTYRDAIVFARRLGIRYLWIDSLCIMQDDSKDWEREAAKMGDVYKRSYLTIAATAAADGEQGCFATSPAVKGCKLSCKLGPAYVRQIPSHRNFMDFDGPFDDPLGPHLPLLGRGWVYQERLLSPRMIHFCAEELVWECNETTICECGMLQDGPTLKQIHARSRAETKEQLGLFHNVIVQYSKLKFTFMKDKFPAFGGLVRQFATPSSGKYLAGLWENSLIQDLCWTVEAKHKSLRLLTEPPRTAAQSIAPSWSWASVDGAVSFEHDNHFPEALCEIVDAHCPLRGKDEFGECDKGGFIILRGRLTKVRLRLTKRLLADGDDDDDCWLEGEFIIRSRHKESCSVRLDLKPLELTFRLQTRELDAYTQRKLRGKNDYTNTVTEAESLEDYYVLQLTNSEGLLLKCVQPDQQVYKRVGLASQLFGITTGEKKTTKII